MDHFRNGARVAGVGEVDNKHVVTLASGQDIGTCQGHGAQGKGRGQGGPQEKAARGKQGGIVSLHGGGLHMFAREPLSAPSGH